MVTAKILLLMLHDDEENNEDDGWKGDRTLDSVDWSTPTISVGDTFPLDSRSVAAVTDDIRAAGDVDLDAVCWRRTIKRRQTDVDPITSRMRGDQHSVCRCSVVAAAGVVRLGRRVPVVDTRPRRRVSGQATVGQRRRCHLRLGGRRGDRT